MPSDVTTSRPLAERPLPDRIASIVREEGGELLGKLLRIGDLVGVARPPRHVSPVRMGEDYP